MDRRDVLMVNQSLDRLGESLLRERMNKQAQSNFESQRADRRGEVEAQRADRREEFDTTTKLQSDRFAEQKAHWKRIEDATQLQAKFKKLTDQKKDMVDGFGRLGELVRAGLPNEKANEYVVATVDGIEDEDVKKQLQQGAQYQAAKTGKIDWSKVGIPPKKEPVPDAKEITIGNRKFAQTANGALIPTDKEPARPFTRTRTNPDDPNDKVTQRMTAEEYEAMEKSLKPGAAKGGEPQVGEVRRGYKFLGGDPASPKSWQKVQ